jgi:hypothetical protein
MHGSGESKHCYFYKQNKVKVQNQIAFEPMFQKAVQHITMGLDHLYQIIEQECSKINGKSVVGIRSCTPKRLSYDSFILFWNGLKEELRYGKNQRIFE